MNKIVTNDGKGLINELGLDAGTLKHQGNYWFTAQKDGNEIEIHTAPADEENETIEIKSVTMNGEELEYCEWCGELMLASEMRKEERMGYLCDRCQRAIESRGEELNYED